jgi:ATP-binding cassette subfamily C protein
MQLHRFYQFLKKIHLLITPFGKGRLLLVFVVVLTQGLFQLIGVTSIFPFLALASNPSGFRESGIGQSILQFLPPLTDSQLLMIAGGFALLMLLLSNLLMLAGEVIRTWYTQNLSNWLRLNILSRMMLQPYSYFLQRNTGELMKKLGDVTRFVTGVFSPLLEGTARVITVVFLFIALVLVQPWLALGAGTVIGCFYAIIFYLLKWRRRHASDQLKLASRGLMRESMQLLSGIKTVKVQGVEQALLERYAAHSYATAAIQKWFPIYNNSPRYLIEPIAFGGIVAILLIYSAQGSSLVELIPTLGVIALAGYRIIPNFQLIYATFSGIGLSMHALEEIHDEFVKQKETQPSGLSLRPALRPMQWESTISLEKVSFTYTDAPAPALNNISLVIPKNSFTAFIGKTGSGKSTLVDLLLGLHWPQSGAVLIDTAPLSPQNVRSWQACVGYVPQEIFLRDDSIAANIAFGLSDESIDMDRVHKVATIAQIKAFIETELTKAYQTQVGERGVRLSGGQRQRIGLARALYRNPSVLILDEATSALDNETETALMEAIENLHGQLTIIVIAHRLSTIQRADMVFNLEKGTIVKTGAPDYFLEKIQPTQNGLTT